MLNQIQELLQRRRPSLKSFRKPKKAATPKPAPVPLPLDQVKAALRVGASLEKNEALPDKRSIDGSSLWLKSLGLPSHHDRQKDWDSLKVLHGILSHCGPADPILDAGSGAKSVILNWLSLLGFQALHACDRVPVKTEFYGSRGIRFTVEDLAATRFLSNQFKAISCVSVIEHGVDLDKFFAEMCRILQPGGLLLCSTDYWSEKIDCTGIYPYGEEHGEMKVFTRQDAESLVETARRRGLEPTGPVDLSTKERAVRWERVDREYTFLYVAFRKVR